ncbi:MAG: hypothetical protein IJ816_03190 [Alloprevotella sp.]|nr:hypothetical protein [Alloprevotella sp.]
MDYKYIEQLLTRYFEAETSIEEEQILRAFFRQDNLPENLCHFAPLFATLDEEATCTLPDSFDDRVLQRISETAQQVVRAERPTLLNVIRPWLQAAAAVVIVVLTGFGAQRAFDRSDNAAWDYNPASFQNSYDNPQQAYKVLENGLELFRRTAQADSVMAPLESKTLQK